jgi:hypothetical protein
MKQLPNLAYIPPAVSTLPPVNPIHTETNDNGAFYSSHTAFTCYAPEWAILNYLERQFGAHNYISIRNGYFDDMVGQRTGTNSRYAQHCSVGDIGLGPRCCCALKSDTRAPTIIRLIRMGQGRASLRQREM